MAKQRKHTDDFTSFWKSVDRWRTELARNSDASLARPAGLNVKRATDGGPGNDSLNRLENAWGQCCEFADADWPLLKDRTDGPKAFASPLGALAGYIDFGLYPPPEVMLALSEILNRYMQAQGKLSLEEAFFGKPVQGAGNFAKRANARRRNFDIAFRVAIANRDGKSDETAAEEVAEDLAGEGVHLEADTILKIANHEMPRRSRDK